LSSQNRIRESTLYPPIVKYLQSIGFSAIGESGVGKGASDHFFTLKEQNLNAQKYLIEVKLEEQSNTSKIDAVTQVLKYARELGTHNVIVLEFPYKLKNKLIIDSDWLEKTVSSCKVKCFLNTEHWIKADVEDTFPNIFSELKKKIVSNDVHIDRDTIIKQIKIAISDLNEINSYLKKEELVPEVVEKLDLFTSIGDIKDKKVAATQITHLSSYLLFNQLLFYRIYRQKVLSSKLPKLDKISKVQDIQQYFDAITKIGFKSIYKVNILGHIPDNPKVIEILNNAMNSITAIRADLVTDDLAGRFFHLLIPSEIRKILAAFYTHPNSADLLAGLTIDDENYNCTITDPACGSGTLLVASYNRKMNIYTKKGGDKRTIHKQFLEKDIGGSDIMPFASHLTTINLAMQEIEQKTNVVRIASMDSLDLTNRLKTKQFLSGKGIPITGFEKTAQTTLTGETIDVKTGGAVSMEGRGTTFFVKPTDAIIMNPPFSRREKMPPEMRNKLNENQTLADMVGGRVYLWGHFIGLSFLLLKKQGVMGAVIPISVARGGATQKVRDFLLNNFTTKFIIVPSKDFAFSENSALKDILYIAEKRKPEQNDHTGIVTLKKSLKEMDEPKVKKLLEELQSCFTTKKDKDTEVFEINFIQTKSLLDYSKNLMPLIGFKSQNNGILMDKVLKSIEITGKKKLKKISSDIMKEGLHMSPGGLSQIVFITNPIHPSRVKKAFLVRKEKRKSSIIATIQKSDKDFEIPLKHTVPAVRTLTGIKSFDVSNVDYIIIQKPKKFDEVFRMSKWKGEFPWFDHNKKTQKMRSYVAVPNRFRPDSPNTHNLAFFSSKKIVPTHAFKVLNVKNSQEGMFQTLLLNSSITWCSVLTHRSQSTGGFTHIMEADWLFYNIFDIEKLTDKEKVKLEKLFKKLQSVQFPSLKDQFENNNKHRRLLDSTLLEILGFEKGKIDLQLDKLYKAISSELSVD
jgi:hypothetical protein